jgi:GT2 family glycosyltransferase
MSSLVREPDAGNPPVRFDEREVETGHGETFGHRQPKGPATRKAPPNPPRHLSTLLFSFLFYLGYPGTTGLAAIGYRLADAITDPPGEDDGYVEELVRVPGPFCCYAPPRAIPPGEGLPEDRQGCLTFGALHKLEKLNEHVLDLWCAILADVPDSRLLLARNTLHGATAERVREAFARRRLAPERLVLERAVSQGMAHLRVYDRIDIALDAFPYGGHTTACEALWMGAPVVSLRGSRHAGRMVASVLTHAELPELVAETPEEYRRTAVALAGDRGRRGELRAGLRERLLASPLCDGAGFTRGLEETYRELWKRWCGEREVWSAAIHRRFSSGGEKQSGDESPHSKKVSEDFFPFADPKNNPRPPRYLVGPVSGDRARHWQADRRAGLCRAFNAEGTADLAMGFRDTWDDVCARLPDGGRPDFVVLYLGYGTVPPCLWEVPVPLVALAPDFQLQWHFLRRVLPLCELVFADKAGVEVMRQAGLTQARYANLFGLHGPFLEESPPEENRDIDVLFIGNLHPAVQGERLPWLGRLAALAGRRRVLVGQGVFGPEYVNLLRRARVVFNRSVRGECNLRVFEAASQGALLFQEAGNREVPAYFADRRECVYYTEDDLESRVEYYLDHEDERQAIAEAGRRKAREYTFAALWEKALDAVRAEWPGIQQRARRRPRVAREDMLLARAWQGLGAADAGDPTLDADLDAALALAPSASLHNARGLAEALAHRPGRGYDHEVLHRSTGHFRQAMGCDAAHPVANLNLVEALAALGESKLAAEGARRLLALLDRPGAADPAALGCPRFPPGYDHFRVAWERAAWDNIGRPAAEAEAKLGLLRWRLHTLLAGLTGELHHHHEAALARPDMAPTRAALGCALGAAGRAVDAVPHLRFAVRANPFDTQAARALSQALTDSGDHEGAARLAQERRLLHRAAPVAVPAEGWFAQAAPAGAGLASIIVLCCNEVEYTRLCMESVLRHTRPPYELVLIDNGSTDATPAYLEELRRRAGPARVEVVRNAANVGYPAGCNQGLAQARGDFVVFLNNDTVVTEGWLDGLVRWALRDGDPVGMVGAVSNYSRPPQQVAVDYTDLEGMAAFAARRRRELAGQALLVERLTGFCLLARREALAAVGGLDERFGLGFFDDDDLSVRVLRAGLKLVVPLDVFVHHFGSRTFNALGVDAAGLLQKNLALFREKWGEREAAGYRLPGPAPEVRADTPAVVNAAPGRQRVSLCLIVKDEEHNLPACLASAQGLFDEIVVLDTGSTDRTREIALAHGARVYDFTWVDSFSAARNKCLRHAVGEWIFWLDADDRLDEANRENLRALFATLKNENVAYSMKCCCLPDPVTGRSTVVDHIRLFRNDPRVRWRYRVHEQILGSVREAGGQVRWADVTIHHTGYQDPVLRRCKLARDLRLLELEYAEQPEDAFTLFNLGQVRQELGQPAEAIPFLRKSLERSHPADLIVPKLYSLLAGSHVQLGQPAEALAAIVEGRKVYPDDPELLFVEGALRQEQNDLGGAWACLTALRQTRPGQRFASVDSGLRGFLTAHNLAWVNLRLGRGAEAEGLWREAVAEAPQFLPSWLGLGELYLAQGRWDDLEVVAQKVEAMARGKPEALLLRAKAMLARKEFTPARAALEEAVGRWPDALAVREKLSHALLMDGKDPEAAERVLREVLERDPGNAGARHNLTLLVAERQRAKDRALSGELGRTG